MVSLRLPGRGSPALLLALLCCGACQREERVPGLSLLPRLAGLWTGTAQRTPLGDIPYMNMDLRSAGDHHLFARTDVDAANNLRFGFSIETYGGADTLVFRNGGFFLGVLRDSRALLREATGERLRFCAASGCDYLDARFLLAADALTLDVKVRGQQHLLWQATRAEPRPTPSPFPVDDRSQGGADAPWPPLPSLSVTVTWAQPLAAAADVWFLLSTRACQLPAADPGCTISRQVAVAAAAGAQQAALRFEQIHPDAYFGIAVLDRDRDLRRTLLPGRGDGVSLPNLPVTVSASGQSTASARVVYDL